MELQLKNIQEDIINWYNQKWDQSLNRYPWRIGDRSPYEILIAEIILQHTTAKAITDNKCYTRFIERFPNIKSIKKINRKELEDIFKPIGLYNQKTERILKLRDVLVKKFDGNVPNDKFELLSLPGVGEYTANAVLTFVYNHNEVPLDNNLKRIGLTAWNIKDRKTLLEFYKKLAKINPKMIYWALFDIGRFHCRKPVPNCKGCPLNNHCKKNQ